MPTPEPVRPIFGPVSGQIDHEDDFGDRIFFGPKVPNDLIVDVTFYKPEGQLVWDSGILFGVTEEKAELFMITDDGWGYVQLVFRRPGVYESDVSKRYQKREDGGVHLRLIIKGNEGWMIVNGKFEKSSHSLNHLRQTEYQSSLVSSLITLGLGTLRHSRISQYGNGMRN